jgi:2-phospho-L-lactate/phosphoenolpyruvate guanylyltransferase
MRTLAVLPVKRFGQAKQRLADGVAPGARVALAEAMVTDVLAALGEVRELAGLIVVTGEPRAAALAERAGAEVVADKRDLGQSHAAALGVARAVELRADRVVLVPGDCPALDPEELRALLADAPPAPSVVVVPDRHGTGTNALVLSGPRVIEPAFGPGSRERHVAAAEDAGAAVVVREVPSLGLDVDTPDDLAALRAALEAVTAGAAATRGAVTV